MFFLFIWLLVLNSISLFIEFKENEMNENKKKITIKFLDRIQYTTCTNLCLCVNLDEYFEVKSILHLEFIRGTNLSSLSQIQSFYLVLVFPPFSKDE